MATRQQKLQKATNILRKYYGLSSTEDLSGVIALETLRGQAARAAGTNILATEEEKVIGKIIGLFLEVGDGTYTTSELANLIVSELNNAGGTGTSAESQQELENIKNDLKRLFKIYGESDSVKKYNETLNIENQISINSLLGLESTESNIVNKNPNNPSKENPGLSVIFSNSKRLDQRNRYSNSITIFMNGMPSIELSRAIPYLDVQFIYPRPQINEYNQKLQSPSSVKFLYGSEKVSADTSNSFRAITEGNEIDSIGTTGEASRKSIAGMEMFTSPQVLVNANEKYDRGRRSVQVLDKFKPFMTIQDFEVSVVSSTGMASFKSAKLSMILHDRSRMSEIADFIKPDLYGQLELLIEYGWSYPESVAGGPVNYYGDLINGMRCIEKFGVSNSSYTFDESGQVSITLELYTRGASDLQTELISSENQSLSNLIRDINTIQREIAELRTRIFSQDGQRTREVRGIQILDSSQDTNSFFVQSSEIKKNLAAFKKQLRNSSNPNVQNLIASLDSLFPQQNNRQESPTSLTERLRRTILESIEEKVRKLSSNEDPFIDPNYLASLNPPNKGRFLSTARLTQEERRNQANAQRLYQNSTATGKRTSLANLFLHFIGQPLANTGKFDDIQMIYYPFNGYAGYAKKINVGQFEVDLDFFTQEFLRNRLQSISRGGSMNLREFLNFCAQTIIDDPASRSYGLYDLYKDVFDERGNRQTTSIYDAPTLQEKMEEKLRSITPNGEFKMPQVDFFIECLPGKYDSANPGGVKYTNRNKSILRIHIFDRVAGMFEGISSIVNANLDTELGVVGNLQSTNSSSTVIEEENRRLSARYIDEARELGIITVIEDPSTPEAIYELKGGPEGIKKLLYKTMPYLIYGAAGTGIKQANLSSMQDAALSTVNMLRHYRRTDLEPNGEQPGGLPTQIIPSELSLQTIGCPLLTFGQTFFVDFQTGTTADNSYAIVSLTHKISQGEFTTDMKLTPVDSYSKYISFSQRLRNSVRSLQSSQQRIPEQQEGGAQTTNNTNTTRRR